MIDGSLAVDFPDWDDASNGEIDVLQLCVSLFRARAKLGEKEKSLLVIDEVFDYLDDANLLVAQHFLLELMKQFKDVGKSICVVILTHLDPSQFKSFRFKKFHASYISPVENGAEKGCSHKILVDRRRRQKSSSIFTRRYLRITCISPIARRCPKMFEHMFRNK